MSRRKKMSPAEEIDAWLAEDQDDHGLECDDICDAQHCFCHCHPQLSKPANVTQDEWFTWVVWEGGQRDFQKFIAELRTGRRTGVQIEWGVPR